MAKLVNCKACDKEIAKGVKKCPHCGKDQRNFFGKHKIMTGVLVLVMFGVIGALTSTKDNISKGVTSNTPKVTDSKKEETKKVDADAEAKQWEAFVTKNTKSLSAGDYTVGQQLDKGIYDVTFEGNGNFSVVSSNGKLLTNEVGGSSLGITKYRAMFTDGSNIKIQGMSINVKPVKQTLAPYQKIALYSGYWTVGQDVTKGRYKVTPVKGSGNFVIFNSSGFPKTNEILGSIGVNEVTVNLENKDVITTSGIDTIQLEPTN